MQLVVAGFADDGVDRLGRTARQTFADIGRRNERALQKKVSGDLRDGRMRRCTQGARFGDQRAFGRLGSEHRIELRGRRRERLRDPLIAGRFRAFNPRRSVASRVDSGFRADFGADRAFGVDGHAAVIVRLGKRLRRQCSGPAQTAELAEKRLRESFVSPERRIDFS